MIKVNEKKYNLESFDYRWGRFTRTYHSSKKTGLAPRLYFMVEEKENSIELLLELTITDDEFKNMPLRKEIDMRDEVIDIGYADNKGWFSLIQSNYTFKLTKLDSYCFLIKFKCEDSSLDVSFEIDEEIMFEYPQQG